MRFEDHRKIPLVEEVFQIFKDVSHNLRYSFDLADKNVGLELIKIAEKANVIGKIEVTDKRLSLLYFLRNQNQNVRLIYTLSETINKLTNKSLNLDRLNKISINTINLRCGRNIEELFKQVIDNNLECYIWSVNSRANMNKVLKLRYKDSFVSAIYTDYPDKLISLIKEHFK